MLEVKKPGSPHSSYAGEAFTKGQFCYQAGTAVNPLGTAGYSKTGSGVVRVANGFTVYGPGAHFPVASGGLVAAKRVFPVDKLEYQPEGSDYSLRTIASGEGLIYWEGGEYETDQWSTTNGNSADMTAATFGALLYLDYQGRLNRDTLYVVSGYPVAEFIQISASAAAERAGVNPANFASAFNPVIDHGTATADSTAENSSRVVWYRMLP